VVRNEEREEMLTEREERFKEKVTVREQLLNRKAQSLNTKQQKLNHFENRVQQLREKTAGLTQKLIESARTRTSVPEDELRQQLRTKIEQDARTGATRAAQDIENEAQLNVER